jgi:hypothetical protein
MTWRERTGIGLLLAGLLAQPLGRAVDRDFRWSAAALCSLGLLSISWERMRRGLGPPSLADLKKDELRDPPMLVLTRQTGYAHAVTNGIHRILRSAGNVSTRGQMARHLTIVRRAVMREWFGAAGAGRQCAPATLIGRFCAALQLHR